MAKKEQPTYLNQTILTPPGLACSWIASTEEKQSKNKNNN